MLSKHKLQGILSSLEIPSRTTLDFGCGRIGIDSTLTTDQFKSVEREIDECDMRTWIIYPFHNCRLPTIGGSNA